MIYRKFSKRQMIAMTWWNKPALRHFDGIICDGAVRSGKTVAVADGFFLWSMTTFRNQCFGICGKTIGALRRNIISNLPRWLGEDFRIRENRGENKLMVTAPGGRKNTYYLFGGQDESAAKSIQGVTLAGILLDEVAIMPRSFVEQACARCSVSGSKLWFSCNPEGQEHWFYKEWIQKAKEKNLLRLHFTMNDNPGLAEAIRRRYEALYTGVFYRRFVLGQWCQGEGLVYDFRPEKHLAKDIPTRGKYYISIDYGTRNPFSAGLWCVTSDRAVRVKEFYHDGRASGKLLTDEEYCDAIERLAGKHKIQQVIADPSAASLLAALRKRGQFSLRKAKNAVLPGIRLVSSLLRQGVLQIAPECADCIREFQLYRWAPEGDAVVKENDHAMDEVRYFCTTILARNRDLTGGKKNEALVDRAVSPPLGKTERSAG